ncbi:hypothetical protein [Gilvibacter sp.]|uniref:hypothetical protein n=1 Tax=Gilvibacter sp. TaxID=2729997 RepID=UPI0025C65DD0|nr:hypothetical protein [Gilvibacter sp.]NQX78826.1 hypothetical protein [Gilvibacter sp.]
MAGDSKPNGKPVAYYIEWSYVQARSFVLNFLALGTMLMFYRVGTMIAETGFPDLAFMLWIMRGVMVGVAYYAIDWGLKIILTDASATAAPPSHVKDISGNKIEPQKRQSGYLWRVAFFAVFITTGISLTSNFFVSADLSGESHLPQYLQTLERETLRDSTMKMQAFNLLEAAPALQSQMLREARSQAKALLTKAINSGSASWKRDYYAHRDKAEAWFWTCTACPREYKSYRGRIIAAIAEGEQIIAEAGGYTQSITASLSPTLSRELAQDSTMIEVKNAVYQLEAERKAREKTINIVLMIMTLAGAILALALTWLLKKHRLYNGQLINDNPARFLMVATDIGNRLRRLFSDVLYSLTFHQHERLLKHGWIISYTVEEQNVTASLHATVHNHKSCEWCDKRLIGKRSDAKYCSDDCRVKSNAEKRASRSKTA